MKLQTTQLLELKDPRDGFTDDEKQISKLLVENTIYSIYAKLPTSRMKAITALHFELGYPQELVAEMFGVTQEQVALDIQNIRKVLTGKPYRPHRTKKSIRLSDLMSICLTLAQP